MLIKTWLKLGIKVKVTGNTMTLLFDKFPEHMVRLLIILKKN